MGVIIGVSEPTPESSPTGTSEGTLTMFWYSLTSSVGVGLVININACFGKVNSRGWGNLGNLGQGVPLVWSCSTWSFQIYLEKLIFGPGPAYPRYHQRLLLKPLQAQVVVDWSKVPCVLMHYVCSATFSQSSWSINLATSPWNLKLSGKQCCFSTPFFPFGHSLLIPDRHLTIVSSGCTGALWHWHALIMTQVSCLVIWYAKWLCTPLSCNAHLSICEETEISYWEMVTDATLNNRVDT